MTERETQAKKIFEDWFLGSPETDIVTVNARLEPLGFKVRLRSYTAAEKARLDRLIHECASTTSKTRTVSDS